MSEKISPAATEADYLAYWAIIEEYVAWLRMRYAGDAWFINEVLSHQSLASEALELAIKYGPPNGLTLMVRCHGEIAAAGAYRRLDHDSCEMKRVYVRDQYKGKGIGRALCEALLQHARDAGYRIMRLDTGNRLSEAIAMYKSLGFLSCPPYLSYPEKLLPYLVFMEKRLG